MKKALVIGSLLVVLTLSLGGTVTSSSACSRRTYEQLRLFTEVLSIVQNQYVDEVPPKELIYSAIKGTLRGLDPHSSFLDPENYREMQVETSGSFGGLGIEITLKDDVLTVVSPIEGTPAHRAGLQTGDRIIKIDGLSTKDMQLSDAVKRMRGKPGTKVTITVVREGWAEAKDFDITREQIRVQSVRSHDLGGGIAYVKLRQFQEQTPGDLSGTLEKAAKNGMKAVGKGSVQTIIRLSDGSGLRLTTAKYFTPNGRSIHGKGITPDIVVELPKEPKEAAARQPSLDPLEDLKKDIQVQRAIDVIKTMRIIEQQRPAQSPQVQVRPQ